MCGRFSLTHAPKALSEFFRTLNLFDFPPRYNIAPTQPVIAVETESGERRMTLMRWGLLPGWVRDAAAFPLLVNARAETMLEKPAFRGSVRHHRCIVPASGYYEWRTTAPGKQPFHVTAEDGAPLALAALASLWSGPEGEEIDTVAIVTVPAKEELAAIHHRMPAILDPEGMAGWLDTRGVGASAAAALVRSLPPGRLAVRAVGRQVNSARNDRPDLIDPVEPTRPRKVKSEKAAQLDLF